MENRPAPHAHSAGRNIERLSPGAQDATATEMNGVAQFQNSGTDPSTEKQPTLVAGKQSNGKSRVRGKSFTCHPHSIVL
jgi:hypothetical protein